MPGEFYIEGKAEKVSLEAVENGLTLLNGKSDVIKASTDRLAGQTPVSGPAVQNWQVAESLVVVIGAHDVRCKLHSLLLSVHNLAGTAITVRLYMMINGGVRKVYEQSFDVLSDPPGLWIVNGTVGLHEALTVTLQSDNAADNGKTVHYDYFLELM